LKKGIRNKKGGKRSSEKNGEEGGHGVRTWGQRIRGEKRSEQVKKKKKKKTIGLPTKMDPKKEKKPRKFDFGGGSQF